MTTLIDVVAQAWKDRPEAARHARTSEQDPYYVKLFGNSKKAGRQQWKDRRICQRSERTRWQGGVRVYSDPTLTPYLDPTLTPYLAGVSVVAGFDASVLMSLKFNTVLNSKLNSPKFCHR